MFARFILNWYPWIMLILVIILFWMVTNLSRQVAELRTGHGRWTRDDLEKAFTAGAIGRDEYERLKR